MLSTLVRDFQPIAGTVITHEPYGKKRGETRPTKPQRAFVLVMGDDVGCFHLSVRSTVAHTLYYYIVRSAL